MDKAVIEQELMAMGKFKCGQVIGEKWKIVSKLDEGGFGSVYRVQNMKDNQLAALKVERANSDEINYLKLETAVLKELHANGIRAHVPQLFRSAKRKHYCYMIITLLGDNLRRLKDKHFPKGYPLRTWSRVGIQCLYGLKTMHDRGYVHRDIKAQNFVLGFHATPMYARVVYIIDFGLARAYAYPPSANCKKWVPRKARARLEFRGTWRYASPSMHEEKEQGRKDDLWSWLYMMMDLYCGLPWLETDNKNTIETKKLHMKDDDLMTRMPDETKFIPKHLRLLDMYQRPDYMRIHAALDTIRKRHKASYEDPYEWENKTAIEFNKKAMTDKSAPIGYTAPEAFFKSDPINIGRAPSAKEEKEIQDRFTVKIKKPEMIQIEDIISTHPIPAPSPDKAATTSGKGSPAVTSPVKDARPGSKERSIGSKERSIGSKERSTGSKERSTGSKEKASGSKDPSKQGRSRSPSIGRQKITQMQKKKPRHKNSSKKERSSEDSTDFVPSCYMNFDIPLHYLTAQNEQTRDFQKKVVSMDWGHAQPNKQFKEAVSPVKGSPRPHQEPSSGPSSDNSANRGGQSSAPSSNRSDNRSDNSSNPDRTPDRIAKPPSSIIQNTLTDDPTMLKKDQKLKKEDPESSNSNKSVSLAGVPSGYYKPVQKKRSK